MRVLHVIPSVAARTGGPAVSVVQASVALAELGVESTIFATDLSAAAVAPPRPVRESDLPEGAASADIRLFPARPPHRLAFSPALYRAVAREAARFDVVHIHSLFLFPQFAAFRGASAADVPFVVSPRGALDPFLRVRGRIRKALADALWQRRMLEQAQALHVTSELEGTLIAGIAPNVRRCVVPNGIAWESFQVPGNGESFRARHLGGHRGRIVLHLGRITFKKGLDVLVRAFARVAADRPDVLLAVVGPDDEGLVPSLRRLAFAEGVGARIAFPGMVAGTQRLDALAAADVWALASHTENFGVAVVEAMAAGLPVVVSRAVNLGGEIEAASAGIVAPAEPAAFAAALARLLDDADARAVLGSRARAWAGRFDWCNVAGGLAAMYEEATA